MNEDNGLTPSPLEGGSAAAAGKSRENGPSDEAIQQAIKATEYKYFGDYPMSDGQIDAVGVLVAAARALIRSRLQPAAAVEGSLKECDCCGEMRPDVRTSYIPHAGDTSACAECRSEGAPQDLRAQAIEECAKWHDAQFDKYAKLAKKAADLQDMTSNGFHADTAQHHMMSAVALRTQLQASPPSRRRRHEQ